MDIIIPKVSLPAESKGADPKVPNGSNGSAREPEHQGEAYSLFEARDEAQVVDALKGRFLEDFVYRFCRRHKSLDGKLPPECSCADVIVGLSWLGVQEAAREYRGIKVPIEKLTKRETEDMIEVMVEALDEKTGNSRIGVASQPRKLRLRTGAVIDDEFCLAKAVAKAQRNAIRPLLPVTLIKAWIEAKLGRPGVLPAPTPIAALLPPPGAPAAAASAKTETGARPPVPPPPPRGAISVSNGAWHPSVGQVKRVFGLAYGHSVSRDQIKGLLQAICGVDDPAKIASRQQLDNLYAAIERGGVPL